MKRAPAFLTRISVLMATLVAAGCTTVGPDYQRSAVTLPAQYPSSPGAGPTPKGVATPAVLIAADWWTLYGEAELTRLVEQALAANADIAQAVARVEQAQGQVREADGALVPTVNAGASASRTELGASVPGNTSGRSVKGNDLKLSLSTSFEIDFWGKLARATEAARAQVLAGALGGESAALNTLLKGPAHFWSLGFGLTAPIFDGGRNAARVDQAGARQREAVGAYQGAVATAFKDVADALANSNAARESQADTELRRASADRAQTLAKARFDAGYSGYLEPLDAQRTATATRLDVVRNRQAQLDASVDLFKALGGGWAGPDTK